jgi:hypothetical protein
MIKYILGFFLHEIYFTHRPSQTRNATRAELNKKWLWARRTKIGYDRAGQQKWLWPILTKQLLAETKKKFGLGRAGQKHVTLIPNFTLYSLNLSVG